MKDFTKALVITATSFTIAKVFGIMLAIVAQWYYSKK